MDEKGAWVKLMILLERNEWLARLMGYELEIPSDKNPFPKFSFLSFRKRS